MDLQGLPENTTLSKLMKQCTPDHELVMTECHDGALILECYMCPFVHTLSTEEEKFVRENVEIFKQKSAVAS